MTNKIKNKEKARKESVWSVLYGPGNRLLAIALLLVYFVPQDLSITCSQLRLKQAEIK